MYIYISMYLFYMQPCSLMARPRHRTSMLFITNYCIGMCKTSNAQVIRPYTLEYPHFKLED